jgi:hypothetical protein
LELENTSDEGGDRLKKEIKTAVLALVVIVGFLCFAGGYYAGGGGVTAYATTREISVNVEVETKGSGTIQETVTIRDGMSIYDALLKMGLDVQTEYSEDFEMSIVSSIAGDNLGANEGYMYTVNGAMPPAVMSDCQLHDDDNVVVFYITW